MADTPLDAATAQPGARVPETYPQGYVWYVIALLAVVNLFNYMDRIALSVLAPSIKADLGLTDGQLGLLIGLAFSLFYAVCGIPVARWADRGTRKNIIAVTMSLWSVMTALCGAAQNFWHLFAARAGVGVGEAGCIPTGQSILYDYVPAPGRPAVYALHTLGTITGMMLGMVLAGRLAESIGWRMTFVALGLPGLLVAAVVAFTLREPRRGNFDAVAPTAERLSFGAAVRLLASNRTYLLFVAFFAANGFLTLGLTQWWPSLYARVFGMSLSTLGAWLGVAVGLGSGAGLLLGGFLANWAAKRDIRRPLQIGAVSTALAIPVAIGSLFAPDPRVSVAMVALTTALWNVPQGPAVAGMYAAVTTPVRTTAGASSIFLTSVLGIGLGPLAVGLLSDLLTPELGPDGLRYALLAPIAALPVMTFALLAVSRRSGREG